MMAIAKGPRLLTCASLLRSIELCHHLQGQQHFALRLFVIYYFSLNHLSLFKICLGSVNSVSDKWFKEDRLFAVVYIYGVSL